MRVERGRGTILYKTLLHMATPHHNGSLFTYIYYTTSNFAKMWHTIHEVLKYLEDPVEDTPVEDTPVEDTPVEDTPVEDTPVEDPSGTSWWNTLCQIPDLFL